MNIHITGTGSYIPEVIKKNSDFSNHSFFNIEGDSIETPTDIIVNKFKAITGISERRYANKTYLLQILAPKLQKKQLKMLKLIQKQLIILSVHIILVM